MKRKILLIVLLFVIIRGFANPIVPPPIFSEIYLNGSIIQLEFYIDEEWIWVYELENFDNVSLVTSLDTVSFMDGIEIIPSEIFVLNQNDLVESLEYNPDGDIIMLVMDDGFYEIFSIRFGNYPWAAIPAPNENQSIAFHDFYDPYPPGTHDYWICLEQPPTIGTDLFTVNARGIIEGHIYDLDNNPVPDVYINYPYYDISIMWGVVTDSVGNFWMPNLICLNYPSLIYSLSGYSGSFSATVLPDETTFVEIQIDTLLQGIPEYYNYPNPFSGSTSFNIRIPDNLNYNSAYVCIYDMRGRLVDRIEIPENQNSVNWQNIENEPGVYLYNLLVDNKKYATQKMIIL